MKNRMPIRGMTAALAVGGMAAMAGGVGLPVALAASSGGSTAKASTAKGATPAPGYHAARASVVDWRVGNASPPPPAAKPKPKPKPAVTRTVVHASRASLRSSDPRSVARAMVVQRWGSTTQFGCLDALWGKESGWRVGATNASSGAYGIPQALPGAKMASAGPDWRTNPVTQIRWGLNYIAARYGTPCAAWQHSQSYNFY